MSWMPTQNSVWQTGCTCKYFLHEWTSQITNYRQEQRLFLSLCWWTLWNRNLCFLLVSAKADTDSLVFLPFCEDTIFHVPILNCDAPKRHAPVPDGGPSGLGLPQTSPSLCRGISYSHWAFAQSPWELWWAGDGEPADRHSEDEPFQIVWISACRTNGSQQLWGD